MGETAISLDMLLLTRLKSSRSGTEGFWGNILPYVDFFVPSAEELCFMLDGERYREWTKRADGRDVTEVIRVRDVKPLGQMALERGPGCPD